MKQWVFKQGNTVLIRCWGCEEVSKVDVVYQIDGFCPICNIEIDTEEDPYQPELSDTEKEIKKQGRSK